MEVIKKTEEWAKERLRLENLKQDDVIRESRIQSIYEIDETYIVLETKDAIITYRQIIAIKVKGVYEHKKDQTEWEYFTDLFIGNNQEIPRMIKDENMIKYIAQKEANQHKQTI